MPIIDDPNVPNPEPATIVTGPDGVLRAYLFPYGIHLRAFFAVDPPFKARFVRDGMPVRSGNDAIVVGGIAHAFDAEIPLDSIASYVVYPVDQGGNIIGDPSEGVALNTPGLDDGKGAWLKSVGDPSKVMQVEVQGDPTISFTGRDTLQPVQGSMLQAGGLDTLVAAPNQFQFKTYTVEELDQLMGILSPAWVVLVQIRTAAGIADFYCHCSAASVAYFRGSGWPERLITAELKPVGRPTTVGAPLVIPGRSFNDTQATAPTFDDRLTIFPKFEDTLGLPVLEIDPA